MYTYVYNIYIYNTSLYILLYLLTFLCYCCVTWFCISYWMKTFLVMVKGNWNSACWKKFQKFCQFVFP